MSIRVKIILILVPFFVFVLILTGTISALTTRSGLVRLAIQGFTFKSNQYEQFINEQWQLLEENELTEDKTFIDSFKDSLLKEAQSLSTNPGESIIGIQNSELIFSTEEETQISPEEIQLIQAQLTKQALQNAPQDVTIDPESPISSQLTKSSPRSWIKNNFSLDGEKNVGYYFVFVPLDIVVLLNVSEAEFFKPVIEIIFVTALLILIASILATVVIFVYSGSLVNPLKIMINSMHHIIETNSFDEKVAVQYRDEIGQLSTTFNVMVEELDIAYQQIKQYAFSAIVAKKNESKIRNIFQKYVPVNVINTLFKDPTSMLKGENRTISIMFTDIRSFTTISESYKPDKLVQVLNSYFEQLVDIITKYDGIIDKYIGDAIMAFFGAPVELENSPIASITAAKDMIIALDEFNAALKQKNLPQFITGIGVNYGEVTVGNIGSEKKMDYTVIGDAVNLGSRLEGLTKQYKQDVIFSSSIEQQVNDVIPCRIVDIVQVKGKTVGEKIYTTTPYPRDDVLTGFALHNEGVKMYLKRDFNAAIKKLNEVRKAIPNDFLAKMYIDRCTLYKKEPPAKDWDGTFIMTTK